jgi:flagellar export protein FliJ
VRFSFPLKALLQKRQREVDRLQKDLSDIKMNLIKESSILYGYINQSQIYQKELFSKLENGTTGNEIDLYRDFLRGNERRIHEKRDNIKSLEMELERTLHSLLEASKKKKALEKIIERGWKKEILNNIRKEMSFLDEIAMRNYIDRTTGRK